MPLVDMKDMLKHAYHHGYAIGAFDLVSLDFLQGIMTAAERTGVDFLAVSIISVKKDGLT